LSALDLKAVDKLERIKNVELIIGIPSYNCAHTINYVIYQSAIGLKKFFPYYKSLILVSNGGSIDGTQEVAQAIKIPESIRKEVIEYKGIPGKGSAIKTIFEVAKFLDSKAVVMVDSDLRSINQHWIKLLVEPILNGVDLVTPFYIRHKYDATITNHVCYPFTQAVYGKRIRQPIGGDFGLSMKLIKKLLESDLWDNPYTRKFGVDIFITHSAIYGGFKIKQAFLGSKVHEAKDPGKHLASMFKQVVGSMFFCMLNYESFWKKVKVSHNVPL
jgi:glycosyltransferase involved in cell wall biosynthesis